MRSMATTLVCRVFSSSSSRSSRVRPLLASPPLKFVRCRSKAMVSAATAAPSRKVLVPIANGTEEMEAVVIVDVLRRAGADVTMASVEEELRVVASRKVVLVADAPISNCDSVKYDLIALPGGMPGAERLRNCEVLKRITQNQAKEQRYYAAICAAPAVALEAWGLLKGLKATCHPSFMDKLSTPVESRVVRDGLVTTSQAPGTAMEFGLALVEQLYGKEKSDEVSKALVLLDRQEVPPRAEFNPEKWVAASPEKPKILVLIANGSEEMEAVIIIDVLRRANMDVIVASVEDQLQIVARRGAKIEADKMIADVQSTHFDAIFLPGGVPGAERLRDNEIVTSMLTKQAEAGKVLGAICASPAIVFEAKKILVGKKATSFPPFHDKLSDKTAIGSRVVIDGKVATSQGPGTAMEFAVNIVEKFAGRAQAQAVAAPMVFPY